MKPVIIGTAGHIDHGKTALVKALTGIDADRLEEEKRRGITIDIGFAHLQLPAPNGEILRLGFVDVPGHERFIRNMLAGIGGIDLVLFVIAADESIKPQTREHFDICRLLGVRGGITVLTKADTVDTETLNVVKAEVEEFLRGSFLDTSISPIIPISALNGNGIPELKHALVEMASQVLSRDNHALARLPIDRVFTMKGFGTVVTGTLISGTIRREEELEIFPGGNRARVRGVQVHGESADAAIAGQRTALNLSGIDKDELKRGMVLAPPSTFNVTSGVDVTLSLLPSAKILKDRARVHLHVYAAETVAKVALYGSKTLAPGETSYAHLKLAEPALLLPGDRFIIRQFSPVVTIGGGVVLDACPSPRGVPFRKLLESGTPREILLSRIHHRMFEGLSLGQAVAATGWREELIESQLSGDLKQGNVVRIGDVLFGPVALSVLKTGIEDRVADFHKHNPLSPGISREVLREKLQVGPELFGLAVEQLVKDTKIQATGDQIHAVGHGVVMKDDEAESKKTIESAFATAGLKVPALKDVLAELKVDKARAHKIVTLLLRDKTLVKIADDLVFHREALENLRGTIAKYKTKSLKINVAQFKELTGVSRKYAIPLLEFLDRERITRRVGDERLIL